MAKQTSTPKQKYTLGSRSKRIYNSGIHPDLKTIIDMALFAAPMDFTLVSGLRTAKEQFELYKIGRRFAGVGSDSNPQGWDVIPKGQPGYGTVTNCDGYRKKSNHQKKDDGFGHAFDFQCYIPGRPDLSYDKTHMAVLIGAFLSIADSLFVYGDIKHRLRSGADWDGDTQYLEPGTFIDMPHLELKKP
jgi:peptidoglycan L-alanyl-D-glutamate endopeptidase CwlK